MTLEKYYRHQRDGYWNSYYMYDSYEDSNSFWEWARSYFKPSDTKIKYQEMLSDMSKAKTFISKVK